MRNSLLAFIMVALMGVVQIEGAEMPGTGPEIETGLGYYAILPNKILLTSSVSGDLKQGVTCEWSMVSGPGTVRIERPQALTTWAIADMPGKYIFKIKAVSGSANTEATVGVNVYAAGEYCGNPMLPGMFPDPHILYDKGMFYIFATSMENEEGSYGRASVWRSKDFVNWEMQLNNWPEYGKFGGDIWAPDIIKKDGKYYQFITRSGGYDTWIAVADNPMGPWKNLREDNTAVVSGGGNAGRIVSAYNMDAQPFIDDDGQAYMYWGWSEAMAAKLTADLKDIDGEVHFLKGTKWIAKGNELPQWLMVDLGKSMPITKVVSSPEFRHVVYGYKIEISEDKKDWKLFADRTENKKEKAGDGYVDTGNGTGRYVRMTINFSSGHWAGLYTFGVYSGENCVSRNKQATASSTAGKGREAANAVDGSNGPHLTDFVEGSYMVKRKGIYYLMYSSGALHDGTYCVRYATGTTPLGPFTTPPDNKILSSNAEQTTKGPGHHSVLKFKDQYYIVYHQHNQPHEGAKGVFRQTSADKMEFNADGTIQKVEPTQTGVGPLQAVEKHGRDIARGKYATASSVRGVSYAAEYALDHNFASKWCAATNTYPQTLTVDLEGKHRIGRIETSFEYPTLSYTYRIETSLDGKQWTKYADHTAGFGKAVSPCIDSGKAEAAYVRITITGCQRPENSAGVYSLRVIEAAEPLRVK